MLTYLNSLKLALLQIPATGEKGFEGLVALVLGDVAGMPFRISGSGLQFGVDGDSSFQDDHVSFECKRYDEEIPRDKVLSKLAELSLRKDLDIWALCATVAVSSQLAGTVRKIAEEQGLEALILDWRSGVDLPPLAVALAMGSKSRIEAFLDLAGLSNSLVSAITASLDAVRSEPSFPAHASRLAEVLRTPLLSKDVARRANGSWLRNVFGSRRVAKLELGQPLAPVDTQAGALLPRDNAATSLHRLLVDPGGAPLICVVGNEGVGKSWLVAMAYLKLEEPPLSVIVTAETFDRLENAGDLESLLAFVLPRQLVDSGKFVNRDKWPRVLSRWLKHERQDQRLLVIVDGINQKPGIDWARKINSLVSDLEVVGGKLLVTTRSAYFESHVRARLDVKFEVLKVSEWKPSERDAILEHRGIRSHEVAKDVLAALLNPRILGIALQLLGNAEILGLNELHVSRLLFEHIRAAERDSVVLQPAHLFVASLRRHALQLIERVRAKQEDDVHVFDGIDAAAEGRFFRLLDGDPSRYVLSDDGLCLALCLALLDHLQRAERNSRDISASLNDLVDPIAALDDTADVLLAAITVACVDESYSNSVRSAVISAYAELQNANASGQRALDSMAIRRSDSFMIAAEHLWLGGASQPNVACIRDALRSASEHQAPWNKMAVRLEKWLRYYSLSPELGLFHADSEEDAARSEKIQARSEEIRGKLEALSDAERMFLRGMTECHGDLSSLSALALELLAGKPLEPFAEALVSWAFSNALNYDYGSPHEDFLWLGRLNSKDWRRVKQLVESSGKIFGLEEASRVGKWAYVALLRFNGSGDDDQRAEALADELTKDRPKFESWRLKEKWCASDPCDPAAEIPANLLPTIDQFVALQVAELNNHFGSTQADHFFEGARVAIARFAPQVTVSKFRELSSHVMTRSDMSLRQGLFSVASHAPLIDRESALRLIRLRSGLLRGVSEQLSAKDRQFLSQECLQLAFPLLTGDEQIEALCAPALDEMFTLNLLPKFKLASASVVETALRSAITLPDDRVFCYLLEYMDVLEGNYSPEMREILSSSLSSGSARVRLRVLYLLAKYGDDVLLRAHCESAWSSQSGLDAVESSYGSAAIVRAVERGLMPSIEAVTRVSPRYFGRLALADHASAAACGLLLDDALVRAAGADVAGPGVVVEIHSAGRDGWSDPWMRIVDEPSAALRPEEWLGGKKLGPAYFEGAQERKHAAFQRFREALRSKGALLALEPLEADEFSRILEASPHLEEQWLARFLAAPPPRRRLIRNHALLLCYHLSRSQPIRALELLEMYGAGDASIRVSRGRARLELATAVVWSGASSHSFEEMRSARLDLAQNDYALSLEVMAAELAGQEDFLRRYVSERISAEEPSKRARAITVVGFSDLREENSALLEKYRCTKGLLGIACDAAIHAYQRNSWARHWFACMQSAVDNLEYWRYSVLFAQVVDVRLDLWADWNAPRDRPMGMFGSDLVNDINRRLERWRDKREKLLFGAPKPRLRLIH